MPSSTAARVRRERVLDAVLLLLQLDLGGRADLDDGDAAGQLGQPLLQLLAVEVARSSSSICALICLMRPWIASSVPWPSMIVVSSLVDDDAAGAAEVLDLRAVELAADLLGDDRAAGQDGDVLEHRLAAVAEAGRLDGERR